jgi:hypothetical protein
MKGDRVEIVVDTGHGTSTFEITASRAGRRLEITTARGVVEVTEVTRGGTPVRTGRFMASRVVALVEHPALEEGAARVEVETRRRMGAAAARERPAADGSRGRRAAPADQMALLDQEAVEAQEPDPMDELRRLEAEGNAPGDGGQAVGGP